MHYHMPRWIDEWCEDETKEPQCWFHRGTTWGCNLLVSWELGSIHHDGELFLSDQSVLFWTWRKKKTLRGGGEIKVLLLDRHCSSNKVRFCHSCAFHSFHLDLYVISLYLGNEAWLGHFDIKLAQKLCPKFISN